MTQKQWTRRKVCHHVNFHGNDKQKIWALINGAGLRWIYHALGMRATPKFKTKIVKEKGAAIGSDRNDDDDNDSNNNDDDNDDND